MSTRAATALIVAFASLAAPAAAEATLVSIGFFPGVSVRDPEATNNHIVVQKLVNGKTRIADIEDVTSGGECTDDLPANRSECVVIDDLLAINSGEGDDYVAFDKSALRGAIGGGPGNDTVYAGPRDDVMTGNDGNDTLHGDEGDDHLTDEGVMPF